MSRALSLKVISVSDWWNSQKHHTSCPHPRRPASSCCHGSSWRPSGAQSGFLWVDYCPPAVFKVPPVRAESCWTTRALSNNSLMWVQFILMMFVSVLYQRSDPSASSKAVCSLCWFLSSLCIFMITLKVSTCWCCWTVLMMSCNEGKLQNRKTKVNTVKNIIWTETLRLAEKLLLHWTCLNKRLNFRVQTVHRPAGVVGLHLVQIHEDVTGNKLLRVFFEHLAWGAAGWCLFV